MSTIFYYYYYALIVATITSADNNCFSYNNNKASDADVLKFVEQPVSYCSPINNTSIDVNCTSNEIGVEIVWHVYNNDDEQNQKNLANLLPISTAITNEPLTSSTLTLTCNNRTLCSFKVWCQLISKFHQSTRSNTAVISLGKEAVCQEKELLLINAPRPLNYVIKAASLSHVTLPCLTIATNRSHHSSVFGTSWYFNGTLLSINGDNEADGTYNIDRLIVDEFFVWSNLTIFHVNAKHAGYYQCFVDGGAFNVIRLDVENNKYNEAAYRLTPPKISEVTLQDKWVQISFQEPAILSWSYDLNVTAPLRRMVVGVIRHRKIEAYEEKTGDQRCLDDLGPGATTHFINAFLVTRVYDGVMTIAFDQLPESFFADELICSQTYWYSVFVKALASSQKMTTTSNLVKLPYSSAGNNNEQRQLDLEIFEQKSGSTFVCLHSNSAIDLLPEVEYGRLFAPALPPQILPKEPVKVIPDCSCLHPNKDNRENNTRIFLENLTYVPFAISGLISATDYCIQVAADCYNYRTPESLSVLSYERHKAGIEVMWQLPMCRNFGDGGAKCQIILKNLFSPLHRNNNNDSTGNTNILQKRVEKCAGRVYFGNLLHANDSHEVAIICNKIDLASKAVPPAFRIFKLSALVVSLAKLLLYWETNDVGEREAALSFNFYACPASFNLAKTVPNLEEVQFLSCLGCHQLKAVAIFKISPTKHYAEIYDFDHNVRALKIFVSADANMNALGYQDTASLGILGNITVETGDSFIDRFRPKIVSVVENVENIKNNDVSWNLTWLPPESTAYGFSMSSFEIVVTPLDSHNAERDLLELTANSFLKIRTSNAIKTSLFIGNVSQLIYDTLASSRHDNNGVFFFDAPCLKLPASDYVLQIYPIYGVQIIGQQQHHQATIEFTGAPSPPLLHDASRLQNVIAAKYDAVHYHHHHQSRRIDDDDDYDDDGSKSHNDDRFSSSLKTPLMATAGAVTFIICLVLLVPYFNKNQQ